jgi:hypothetical protein
MSLLAFFYVPPTMEITYMERRKKLHPTITTVLPTIQPFSRSILSETQTIKQYSALKVKIATGLVTDEVNDLDSDRKDLRRPHVSYE